MFAKGRRLVSGRRRGDWNAAGRPGELDRVCPQRFEAPLAPHLAALAEGRRLDPDLLRQGLDYWRERSEIVLVEGAGGLMSPLGRRRICGRSGRGVRVSAGGRFAQRAGNDQPDAANVDHGLGVPRGACDRRRCAESSANAVGRGCQPLAQSSRTGGPMRAADSRRSRLGRRSGRAPGRLDGSTINLLIINSSFGVSFIHDKSIFMRLS